MKQGWTYKKVGDVFKTYSGGTPIKSQKEYYENGDIPWIRSGEVCRKYITESEMFITQAGLENSSAKYFPIDTVLVAMYGATAAQVGILKIKATSNQAVCGILPNEHFIPEFVYYWFKHIESDLASQAQGGAQPNISQEKIKKVDFPILSLVEQERIVERLDAAFAQIDELKSNAERQLAEARALFQSALTQAMQPRPGWQEKTLKEIVDANCPISYGIVQQGEHVSDGIPVVRPIDLNQKYVERKGLKCTDESISNRYKRTILQGNEILLSVRGTTGVLSLASPELKGCNVNRGIVPLFFKDFILRDFVYYYMESPQMQRIFAEKTTGSTLKQINIKDLRFIGVIYPPLSEQQAIVEHLDALSNNVKELEEINRKTVAECDALKQALLRQIFE